MYECIFIYDNNYLKEVIKSRRMCIYSRFVLRHGQKEVMIEKPYDHANLKLLVRGELDVFKKLNMDHTYE